MRRQFNRFIEQQRGGIAAAFVKKASQRQHVTRDAAIRDAHVYLVSAKPIYAALDQADNRHRRRRSPFGIKAKLMALDYVLEHLPARFLATERERVEYFLDHGIARERLPHLTYRAAEQGPTTDRYFVEKFPLSVHDTNEGTVVTLTYIDTGEYAADGFDTFLRRYAALIHALSNVALVYVADTDRNFDAARRRFEAWRRRLPGSACLATDEKSVGAMLRFFDVRQCVDTNRLERLTVPQLRQFREERPRFGTPEAERLYGVWKEGGEPAVRAMLEQREAVATPHVVTFAAVRLPHDYGFLGTGVYT